jgi:hypothetical protein
VLLVAGCKCVGHSKVVFTAIPALRRIRHGWATRLMMLVVAVGLLIGTGQRVDAHSHHHDDSLGTAHHALLTGGHALPAEPADSEPAAAHFHYAATLVFVASPTAPMVPAGLKPLGVLGRSEELPPPLYQSETLHRPPIA